MSGSIVDQVGGLLPYVTVELTNRRTRAHDEARTDQVGHFEITGLPAGEYLFEANLAAFVPIADRVTLSPGDHLEQNVTLHLAGFEDRIAVTSAEGTRSVESSRVVRSAPAEGACERSAVGGDVRAPRRIREVRPVYPPDLVAAGIQGSVVVAGRIDAEGRLEDPRVLRTAHPALAVAAVAALTESRWSQPRLDCVPVDGHITITVDFRIPP